MQRASDTGLQLAAGMACVERGEHAAALVIALALLEQDGKHVEAMHLAGLCSLRTGQAQRAAGWLESVINRQPTNAHAHWRLGKAWYALGRVEAACACFDDAHALGIDEPALLVDRFLAACDGLAIAHQTCAWRRLGRYEQIVCEGVTGTRWMVGEITLASAAFSNAMSRRAADNHAVDVVSRMGAIAPFHATGTPAHIKKEKKTTLRLGFVGEDFYEQATAYLMTSFIEAMDRERCEIWAYDTGPERAATAFRQRVVAAYDHFIELRAWDDTDAAARIHADEIDILLSMKSLASARLGIFSRRPAPIQLHFLYYPGTSGMPFFDYIVADAFVIPIGKEDAYAEKVLRLPGCYQPNDRLRPVPSDQTLAEWALPAKAVVLANFGQAYKITPAMFNLWCVLLQQDARRILWLLDDNPDATRNLRREARARGIDPDRLHFAQKQPTAVHLNRLRCADLVLDTYPYGGHTLTSDALWAGTPVVTLCGDCFASRVAGSLLTCIGLSDLIASTELEYLARAERVLSEPGRGAAMRAHLDRQRMTNPLFSAATYAANFYSALAALADADETDPNGEPPLHSSRHER